MSSAPAPACPRCGPRLAPPPTSSPMTTSRWSSRAASSCSSDGRSRSDRRAMTGWLGPSLVSRDKLIGNFGQVVADDLRLRADAENVVAGTLDQRRLPARGDGAERVPCVAGDEAELGGLD